MILEQALELVWTLRKSKNPNVATKLWYLRRLHIIIILIISIIIIIIIIINCLAGAWPLFQFLNFIHSGLNSLVGESPRGKAAIYTQDNTNRINAHRHSCLERDLNPRRQHSSLPKQFMPYTAQPPLAIHTTRLNFSNWIFVLLSINEHIHFLYSINRRHVSASHCHVQVL
jgi:hypothetical protein